MGKIGGWTDLEGREQANFVASRFVDLRCQVAWLGKQLSWQPGPTNICCGGVANLHANRFARNAALGGLLIQPVCRFCPVWCRFCPVWWADKVVFVFCCRFRAGGAVRLTVKFGAEFLIRASWLRRLFIWMVARYIYAARANGSSSSRRCDIPSLSFSLFSLVLRTCRARHAFPGVGPNASCSPRLARGAGFNRSAV